MNKKLIALAVAGLVSGSAFAQSNVQIYGLIDMGFSHAKGDADKTTGINSGINDGSRLGFKGTEALGNGISAVFNLEYQLYSDRNVGIGTGGFNSRKAYIGLTGNFGTVVAGRLNAPGDYIEAGMDSTDQSNSFSALYPLAASLGSTMSARLSNAVAYVSPAMGGFTFVGALSFAGAEEITGSAASSDGKAYSSDQERIFGARISYEMGPLALAYAHHRVNDLTNAPDLNQREHMVGGTYDLGVAKLFGTYQTVKTTNGGATINKGKVASLGATVPVGNDLVRVQFARGNPDGADNASTGFGIRFDHVLSKRTFAYIGYNRIGNDDGAAVITGVGNVTAVPGESSSGYGFGIEHAF